MQEQQQQQLQQQQAQALAFPGQMVMRPANADPAASLQQSASVPADGEEASRTQTAGVNTEPSGTESLKNTTGADHEAGGDAADKS
ncbi:hypothetical protein HU200_008053 [Digitaria exilis]|uniref:Uncharacterized protein n=1 Tax=Digitaria exilis TaxID=1010633 RepID=A0A835KTZ2_9POAL|nr:hypothetical protein HU200_008053 [Digitaria exilis]